MAANEIVLTLFFIFAGAAVLSTVALFTRQSLLVAYMLLGVLLGPWGLGAWGLSPVGDQEAVQKVGEVGIVFLMFLLGLHLQPQNLYHMLKKTLWVSLVSSVVFLAIGYAVGQLFGYNMMESLVIGLSMMFSSTIIGLKLLPTTVLHHQHTGEVMISVLLMQDLIAILVLLLMHGASAGTFRWHDLTITALALPAFVIFGFLFERFILIRLFAKFDRVREYMFLVSLAWCLGMAELANMIGLSYEIGAFIAGVSIASSPISQYIAESLKPLRDFFLVMFFFSVGASFNLDYVKMIYIPAALLAVLLLILKPLTYRILLGSVSETNQVAWEVGVRLGQSSEFSLLVGYLALSSEIIGQSASNLIQAATMFTFVVSSYFIVLRYPTPMGTTDLMRRD
ncbi:MAG: cation:proton antiporter [Gammaproteobacteria bacterium]|nr:cation:proton antiporter [Gammaproteobacteria bacterium]